MRTWLKWKAVLAYFWLLRRWLNLVGWWRGFGYCFVCRDSWNWKRAHHVRYCNGGTAFPCCKDCWNRAPLFALEMAILCLSARWKTEAICCDGDVGSTGAAADAMRAALIEAAQKRGDTCFHAEVCVGKAIHKDFGSEHWFCDRCWARHEVATRIRMLDKHGAGGWMVYRRTEFGMVPVRS